MHDGDHSIEHPRRSWLPHPAWLTLGAMIVALLAVVAWVFWPFVRSSRLATEIEANGGTVQLSPSLPGWMRDYVPSEFHPELQLIHGAELRDTAAADALVVRLARERELETLILRGHQITDTAIDALRKNPSLQALLLIDCPGATRSSLDQLQKSRPQLKVLIRGPAFLGVEGLDDPRGCLLQTVRAGSPAAVAGLLPTDIITRFDGEAITGYDSLVKAISLHQPGDKITITYLRDSSEQKTHAVVAAWN